MELIWDRYYSFTKRVLSLAGQWPYQNKNEKMLRLSIVTTAVLVINVPQTCKFIQCDKNLECITRTLPPYILVLVVMVKLYISQFRASKIKILTDRVSIDWKRLQNVEEYEIMETYVTSARWIVLMYTAVCMIGLHIFILVSLIPHILDIVLPLNESRPIVLPFEAYYFVDERKYFFYIFCYDLIAAEIGMIGLIAYDIIFFTFVEHVCGIFAVTGFRFEHLVFENIDAVKVVNNDTDETYNNRMACSVDAHRAALEFAERLENTFSLNFGIELLLVTVVLSITLLQITMQSEDTVETMRYVLYVLAQLVHLLVFCCEGQRLIDHSLQIRDKM
ncbi:PREDICTED: uncharacterized protein LOC106749541 [Dinoponera quadriceps]|uniref:Uncharacterized protein LOC106749541 n=1 Tax=Dinoponera quadriceps TaxID=609295 RepID=A0A6P3Y393_DINQU|nr:PREDICTED: uncharacterized protein LOC106749541 [Dinoponera quadriceps]